MFQQDHRTNASHWQLPAERKYADYGVTRSVHPRETIRRARAVLGKVGVTRVGEVTYLDRLGIPIFMAVRPRAIQHRDSLLQRTGISYYCGKGTTRDDAHAGVLMEAIERHGGEHCNYVAFYGTYNEVTDFGPAVHPKELLVPKIRDYHANLALEWVQGFDLIRLQPTFVPLNSVVCPYWPDRGSALYYASTNGLASGNTLAEALCHALCEVIERDSESIAMAAIQVKPAVDALLARITGRELEAVCNKTGKELPLIAHRHLPRRAALTLGKMKRAGLRVYLRNLTCTAGIPTIDCTIVDQTLYGTPSSYAGCGTHPDARVALTRTLTEAAQVRAAHIQGEREDLPEITGQLTSHDPDFVLGQGAVVDFNKIPSPYCDSVFSQGDTIEFSEIPSYRHNYINEDVDFLLERLKKWGLDQVVAFDLTHPEVGIPVVRVVIPGAEAWKILHPRTKRGVFGKRVEAVLRSRPSPIASRQGEGGW